MKIFNVLKQDISKFSEKKNYEKAVHAGGMEVDEMMGREKFHLEELQKQRKDLR